VIGPNLNASGTRFSPLHDLAVKTLPRSHGVDVHASDLVGIDGITRVLIVHIPQDIYQHVLENMKTETEQSEHEYI
jgi:hypothetical protein